MKELAKQYDPSQVEDRIYQFWLDGGYFHTEADPDKKPYTIVMPPPNVTGQLHMGHALDNTMQDVLIRTKRMQGYAALWVPGTDHASIATEAKVVEAMRQEGLTKEMVGRDGFLERAWAWKTKYGNRIVSQLKKLGSSCDWERERFTMDEGCSEAVKEVFVRLYDKGLIYRGNRMVNWCPHCNTSISDAEVEYEEKDGSFWHLLYPVKETGEMLELATTRPETMLGDTAVAINGDDPRYAHLHGCHVILPLLNKEIPIVCDEHADMTKGTGVVKITPAHDPNDFEVGLRHNLDVIRVIADDGHINENGGKYNGMDRYECRKALVKDLEEQGYLVKTEPYSHNVGTCYRCHNDVEPLISAQWFVKMKPLAEEAIRVVKDGTIKFVPERFSKTYLNWMENVHDWCISRQLWWGHQIPAWYCDECGHINVSREDPTKCEKCGCTKLTRDEDVLDTWFSSWLWPISVFDGIRRPNNKDIEYYYPTNDLVTGPDIIFFWVARMIMAGYEYRGEKPFGHVYFTGIVRDKIGRKMSKQLGNSPDPLDLIAQFGADGMRVAMLLSSSAGNDVMFDEALCEQGRNFGNKIWNAYRLVNGWTIDDTLAQSENNRLAIEWFRQALAKTLRQVESDFASYRISEAFMNLYKLFWDDFSGWYLEMIKPAYQCPIDRPTLEATCGFFDDLLRLLHPFMPFVTEEIWQDLAPRKAGESIMVQRMPEAREIDEALLGRFELTKEVVTAVRNVRKQKNIPQKDPLTLRVIADENYPAEYAPVLQKMGNLSQIETTREKDPSAVGFLVKTTQYFVPMEGMIDIEAERKKLAGELEYLEGFLASVQKKLSNERFVSSAPEKVVANERTKQADAEAKIAALREQLAALK